MNGSGAGGFIKFNPWKSLTVAGTVGFIGTGLVAHFAPDALSGDARVILQAATGLLGMIGIRNAVAKAAINILTQLATKR